MIEHDPKLTERDNKIARIKQQHHHVIGFLEHLGRNGPLNEKDMILIRQGNIDIKTTPDDKLGRRVHEIFQMAINEAREEAMLMLDGML
jgi:hypothetical protein